MNLEKLFNPKSIAVIGASRDKKSVGYGILKNLKCGGFFKCRFNRPFRGKIFAVNPNAKKILGFQCYGKVTDIPFDVDLAIICVPSKIVKKVAYDCVEKEVGSVIIISAGFSETGKAGRELEEEIISLFKKKKIPVLGPNCLGLIRPSSNLNATFSRTMPPKGHVSFITQSGALADSVIDWAIVNDYGFSNIVSCGNQAYIEIHHLVQWAAKDKETKAIALYIESLKDGRKFVECVKKINKPIVVLKAGKTFTGKKAVSSHTGSLAGDYDVYKAAFKQFGIIEVETIDELFDIAKVVAEQPKCKNEIAIVTNGGGCGVVAADHCAKLGVNLVELKEKTIKKLDESGEMHPAYSKRNPLDLIGDALPKRYEVAINTLLSEEYIHGLIVIQTLQTMTDSLGDAKVIVKAKKRFKEKPIICAFLGGKFTEKGVAYLKRNNVPVYDNLKKAVMAISALIELNNRN